MSRARIRIELADFEDSQPISDAFLKSWFPDGGFDKRSLQESIGRWQRANAAYLSFLGVSMRWSEKGKLTLCSSNKIGLAPLRNPRGRMVYGTLCVKPRTGMHCISDILDAVGWQPAPTLLPDEEPIVADGVLPRWFRALRTLASIHRALSLKVSGSEARLAFHQTPRAGTDWNRYASCSYPLGKHLSFQCVDSVRSFDLEIHRQFKGIAAMIRNDLAGPGVPHRSGLDATRMLARIESQLRPVEPATPSVSVLLKTRLPSLYREAYRDAVARCAEYLEQGRISLYAGDLGGTPWSLDMEKLFETWVAEGARQFARSIGADCYSDNRGTSRIRFIPLGRWRSLRLLKPDVVIEKDGCSIILDAKYKRTLLHLAFGRPPAYVEADHRSDLHQVLAYAGVSVRPNKVAALLYPRSMENPVFEVAKATGYRSEPTNLIVILADVPFDWSELLRTLKRIWTVVGNPSQLHPTA